MKMISLNGIELAFEEIGTGVRTLLLVHGHPFDHTMWRPQFEPIARLGWRVVAPDLRGYGASSGDSSNRIRDPIGGTGAAQNVGRPLDRDRARGRAPCTEHDA